ncbi:MAG TPA: hypothetical protein VGS97_28630 [Actinocrinis sp.]|uniref:hypothetical protein n=1 Tax=Actinocrinis sp. TaxID=1920516 RepID=UPI002DDCDE35|nr:hypothetical protein [Actinocrinis sp.]HEV2348087.1 hypothetical protein [Actinocrinis sp.]
MAQDEHSPDRTPPRRGSLTYAQRLYMLADRIEAELPATAQDIRHKAGLFQERAFTRPGSGHSPG